MLKKLLNKHTLGLSICLMVSISSMAQTDITEDDKPIQEVVSPEQAKANRLAELDEIIRSQTALLSELRRKAPKNGVIDLETQTAIEQKSHDIAVVKKSFEQIAIGRVSADIFNEPKVPKDWQEELTLVVKPLLENLRSLTEKPRKKENLRQTIETQKSAVLTASLALSSIDTLKDSDATKKHVDKQLEAIKEKWQRRLTESEHKIELATIELSNLNGDTTNWVESIKTSLNHFAQERGLTLLIAIFVAISVVLFFKAISGFISHRRHNNKRTVNRTTYRIIAYAQRLLTGVFVVIGIVVVFFLRGDVLLLAISSVLLFAAVLGLRHFLPQFLQESRILLNIGRVREQELVNINGVPWKIASINVFSKLINPEIKGVLRLPLEEMITLTSRKVSDEKWFPSSIGDWVMDDQSQLYEVIGQGPDAVELQSAQGTNKLVCTSAYYAAGFVNLTKSKVMRITSVFGVDYNLQSKCLDVVPQTMQACVQTYLESANFGTTDIKVRVEFQTANASSLDYLIIVNINANAARHYYRIRRSIQQACVQACNENGWGIPFPQLTISKNDEQ